MKRTLSILLAGGLLAAVAVPAVTMAAPHKRGHDVEQRIERMAETLDLTQAQQDEIRGIFEANKADAQAMRQEIKAVHKALSEAIEGGADNDTIAELAIEAHTLRADGRELRKEVRKEVGAVLTPEQKEILKAKRAERGGKRGKRGGGFERGGGERGGSTPGF